MAIPQSIKEQLNQPYPLTDAQIAFYEQNRFIKLKQVFDQDTIDYFNGIISEVVKQLNKVETPLEERSTYGKAFLQLFNLWREDELIKELVFSKRIGKKNGFK